LDFLGFSRQKQDLSMGYADFSVRKISHALPQREKPENGRARSGDAAGGIGHEDKLNPTSDFPQEIVRALLEHEAHLDEAAAIIAALGLLVPEGRDPREP
jgi:hypothetical protein